MPVIVIGAALSAIIVGAWFGARWIGPRWMGHERPCPVWLAAAFDNPYTDAYSGVATLVDRAGVVTGMRVLDAGCGPGRVTIPLARRVGASGEVVALDVQERMLDRVRRNATRHGVTNIRTIRGRLTSDTPVLQEHRDAFDCVLLVFVLGEISDRLGALRSLYAVVKPGGMLSISEVIIDPDYQPGHRVRRLAESAGFEFDRSFGTPLMFMMNFRRQREFDPDPD